MLAEPEVVSCMRGRVEEMRPPNQGIPARGRMGRAMPRWKVEGMELGGGIMYIPHDGQGRLGKEDGREEKGREQERECLYRPGKGLALGPARREKDNVTMYEVM